MVVDELNKKLVRKQIVKDIATRFVYTAALSVCSVLIERQIKRIKNRGVHNGK